MDRRGGEHKINQLISALLWEASHVTEDNHISPKPTSMVTVRKAVEAYNGSLIYRLDHKAEKHVEKGKHAASSKGQQLN